MDKQKIFASIKSFVSEINNTYGSHYKHLAMYGRLIEKTNNTHEIPVNKHISAFRKFIIANREAIVSKNDSLFKVQKIKYSDNVYFNITNVFKLAEDDSEATGIIWEHLLVLSALLDANSNAKDRLKSDLSSTPNQQLGLGDMSTMLLPLMNMFTSNLVNPSDAPATPAPNPLEALLGSGTPNLNNIFSDIMGSGILPKMMNTFSNCMGENNQIDFKKLLDSVQDLLKDLNINIPPDVDKNSQKLLDLVKDLGINIPTDVDKNSQDLDKLMGAFENVGLDKSTMKSMVDTIVSGVQQNITVPETETDSETDELKDLTEPVVSNDDVQVCYIGGDCH